jgi:hypothetical protein
VIVRINQRAAGRVSPERMARFIHPVDDASTVLDQRFHAAHKVVKPLFRVDSPGSGRASGTEVLSFRNAVVPRSLLGVGSALSGV